MTPTPEIRKAEELAHWRGEIDGWKKEIEAHVVAVGKSLKCIDEKQDEQHDLLTESRVRRTIAIAGVSLVVNALVTLVVLYATKVIE